MRRFLAWWWRSGPWSGAPMTGTSKGIARMNGLTMFAVADFYEDDVLQDLDLGDTEREMHLTEMCQKIREFVNNEDYEKASRWLGFIQGVLWAQRVFTIDEMREHNMGNFGE